MTAAKLKNTSPSAWKVLAWLLALAALCVGARNFEEGLSLDGPVYATIARNIAAGGSWFRLSANIPDFVPFAEHPHLGFWLQAVLLKVLPAQDWAVRVLGHLWFVAFLFLYFTYLRRKTAEAVAVVSVLLLVSCHLFSNTFSTFYLDPGVLTLGTLSWVWFERAVSERRNSLAIGAGIFLALAVLYKGLTILGFLPAFAYLALGERSRWKQGVQATLVGALSFTLVLVIYVLAIRASDCPEFLSVYWQRQVTARFSRRASIANIFRAEFWWQLWKYSNFALPLMLLTLPLLKKRPEFIVAWLLAGAFVLQFAANGLTGGQYLIMILPWVIWLAVEAVASWYPALKLRNASRLQAVSAIFCLVTVFILQYVPVRLHGIGPLPQWKSLRALSDAGQVATLYLDVFSSPSPVDPFIRSSSWAWYAKVEVLYPQAEAPAAARATAFYQYDADAKKTAELKSKGWCLHFTNADGQLWVSCLAH